MMDAELQLLLSQALDPFSGPSDGASVGCSRFFAKKRHVELCKPTLTMHF